MINTLLNLIILIISISPLCIYAQNNGNITVSSTITAAPNSNPWLSPSGDFAFGFRSLQNNSDLFVLSIWFNRIPDRTIVWFERTSYPVTSGSTLQLDTTQGLVLRDSRGRLLWNTNNFSNEVSYGFMNNTGNFVLFGSNLSQLWQSFSNPSDTILPTQTIEIDGTLVSRRTATNFSEGRFHAHMLGNGNFVFEKSLPRNTIIDDEYYNSGTSDINASNSGYQLLFNERGSISVMKRNGQATTLTPQSIPSASDYYYRATLDFDGIFTQYYHPRNFTGNPGWTTVRTWPDNICITIDGAYGSGTCGFNSVCTLQNQRPVCQCPQGFSLADPNNPYGDCMARYVPNCVNGNNGSMFDLLEIPDTDWPINGYERISPITEDDCKKACLEDCLCAAVNFLLNRCWKKSLPLTNGRVDTTLGIKAFVKYRRGDVDLINPNSPVQSRRDQKRLILVGSALLASSVFINFLFLAAACTGLFLIYRKKVLILSSPQSNVEANLRCFTYKELVQATNGFKEELGRGAFGIVYKGEIPHNSKSVVAVKKLDRVSQDSEKEFKAEVNTIGQTHHKNLVQLLGFCHEGPNRLVVYEYMSNGTLADFLFGTPKQSWSMRCQIALGVAKGLTYLHEDCSTQIIHCDIKPQNILIDEHYNPRISDFGLAKLLMMDQTQTLTNIRGTKGYVAPEWFRNTQITAKVDVYSFGVLLLETISCRKNVAGQEKSPYEENPILTDWVWDCFQEKRLDSLVDDDIEALSDTQRLARFVMVGIWCIQEDVLLRPTMRKVSQMLEGNVEVTVPPCPSPFFSTT